MDGVNRARVNRNREGGSLSRKEPPEGAAADQTAVKIR